MGDIQLIQGDCLKEMQKLIQNNIKVDLVLTDLPYGTTANKWDTPIDLNGMWKLLEGLIKNNRVVLLFSEQPFTSYLITSNLEQYRYSWIWQKEGGANFLNSNYAPIKVTEDINVFSSATIGSLSKNPIPYNPQGLKKAKIKKRNNPHSKWRKNMGYDGDNQLNNGETYYQKFTNYPTNILKFKRDKTRYHTTQKPVKLLEYLIKTYTNEGDLVLDFTMGSGSTGVACYNTNRGFIGIEIEEKYFNIAVNRIKEHKSQSRLGDFV